MAKVITYSKKYPSYHPKTGEATFFVEKFYKSLAPEIAATRFLEWGFNLNMEALKYVLPKHHTIRASSRWKVGDMFSPRIWGDDVNPRSGKRGPYHSKQIVLCPDLKVKKIWRFEIVSSGIVLENKYYPVDDPILDLIAQNDGLTKEDMLAWFKFPKLFKGQIICWNNNINY